MKTHVVIQGIALEGIGGRPKMKNSGNSSNNMALKTGILLQKNFKEDQVYIYICAYAYLYLYIQIFI